MTITLHSVSVSSHEFRLCSPWRHAAFFSCWAKRISLGIKSLGFTPVGMEFQHLFLFPLISRVLVLADFLSHQKGNRKLSRSLWSAVGPRLIGCCWGHTSKDGRQAQQKGDRLLSHRQLEPMDSLASLVFSLSTSLVQLRWQRTRNLGNRVNLEPFIKRGHLHGYSAVLLTPEMNSKIPEITESHGPCAWLTPFPPWLRATYLNSFTPGHDRNTQFPFRSSRRCW